MPSVPSMVRTIDRKVGDRDSASTSNAAIAGFVERTRGIDEAATLETTTRQISTQDMRERELRAIRHLSFHLRTLRSVQRYRRTNHLPG